MTDLKGSIVPRNAADINADLDLLDTLVYNDYHWQATLRLAADVEPLLGELDRVKRGLYAEQAACEAELAAALGYEYGEEYGWNVGDHTITTLAMEAKHKIEALEAVVSGKITDEVKEQAYEAATVVVKSYTDLVDYDAYDAACDAVNAALSFIVK